MWESALIVVTDVGQSQPERKACSCQHFLFSSRAFSDLIISVQLMVGDVIVVYGSQTGTAYDAALWLHERLKVKVDQCTMVDGNNLSENGFRVDSKYIFIVATAGNGDFPSNFRKLWISLVTTLVPVARFDFAVFGLGDSKYPQYNYAARKVYGKVQSLGANPICQLGCGDEQHILGVSHEFIPWTKLLWRALFEEELETSPNETFEPCADIKRIGPSLSAGLVVGNGRVTADSHFQDVRHMKFRLLANWKYEPGDVVVVYPKVAHDTAERFIRDILSDDPATMVGSNSLMYLLTSVLDISHVPTIVFYERLFAIFKTQLGRSNRSWTEEEDLVLEKLRTLGSFSPEGANERLRYSGRERLGIHEVLQDFSHIVRIGIRDILDVIPEIQPRYYSVCSVCNSSRQAVIGTTARVSTCEVEICVAIVSYTTLWGRKRRGLTSTFLGELSAGQYIDRLRLERGFNSNLSNGLRDCEAALLVGPGTGISPLRAIVQQIGAGTKRVVLLTGFRHEKTDFLFKGDLTSSDYLTCIVGWSRPEVMDRSLPYSWSTYRGGAMIGGTGCREGRKTWVQDLFEVENDLIRSIFSSSNVLVVISGRSHPMPYQVVEGLERVVGKDVVDELRDKGRIIYDTWG